jgi:hypothetical protein
MAIVHPIDEDAMRGWCEALAQRVRVEHIERDGEPYLERYYVAGWNPITKQSGPAIFLHRFLASDPATAVHSHPWDVSLSLILVGGYREQRCGDDGRLTEQDYRPGDFNIIRADDRHRIDLLAEDCWTLFLAGPFAQPWRFHPACEARTP